MLFARVAFPKKLLERWPPVQHVLFASYVARSGAGHPNFLFSR
jgi:hypothetical protein